MASHITIRTCEDPDVLPVCPKCGKEIREFLSLPVSGGLLNQQSVVVCPHCHVVVGYGKVNYF